MGERRDSRSLARARRIVGEWVLEAGAENLGAAPRVASGSGLCSASGRDPPKGGGVTVHAACFLSGQQRRDPGWIRS